MTTEDRFVLSKGTQRTKRSLDMLSTRGRMLDPGACAYANAMSNLFVNAYMVYVSWTFKPTERFLTSWFLIIIIEKPEVGNQKDQNNHRSRKGR